MLAGNGIIMLIAVLILALIPAGIIYSKRKNKMGKKTSEDVVDAQETAEPRPSFYFFLSKYTFYIGLVIYGYVRVVQLIHAN